MAGSATATGGKRPPAGAASNRPDPSAVAATKKRAGAQNREAKAAYQRGRARSASGAKRSTQPRSPADQARIDANVADLNAVETPQDQARAAQAAAIEAQGAADALAAQRAPSRPQRSVSTNLSSVVLGALAYAVLVNFLQGGADQVRAWFAAKFLNRPMAAKGTR